MLVNSWNNWPTVGSYNVMGPFLAFFRFCVGAPINELECGPFWLVVSFIAFGLAATITVLLVKSYSDWYRQHASRIKQHRRPTGDDLDLNDPDFENAIRKVINPSPDGRQPSKPDGASPP
jgi:hypothetical protein